MPYFKLGTPDCPFEWWNRDSISNENFCMWHFLIKDDKAENRLREKCVFGRKTLKLYRELGITSVLTKTSSVRLGTRPTIPTSMKYSGEALKIIPEGDFDNIRTPFKIKILPLGVKNDWENGVIYSNDIDDFFESYSKEVYVISSMGEKCSKHWTHLDDLIASKFYVIVDRYLFSQSDDIHSFQRILNKFTETCPDITFLPGKNKINTSRENDLLTQISNNTNYTLSPIDDEKSHGRRIFTNFQVVSYDQSLNQFYGKSHNYAVIINLFKEENFTSFVKELKHLIEATLPSSNP